MKTSDFDYFLPPGLIAQSPLEPRDHSRLMVLNRGNGSMEHRHFYDLPAFLKPGDVLVFNDSRVIPARLMGHKNETGGKVEILLLRRIENGIWEALVKPGKRVRAGTRLEIESNGAKVMAEVTGAVREGVKLIRFPETARIADIGVIPLPPYIHLPLEHPERYQTVYSREAGSVAAPTAGLHFTEDLLEQISSMRCRCLFVTLHVGLDTFRPVREDDPLTHPIHQEYGVLGKEVADELAQAKADGRRVIAVGTTTVRILEEAARQGESLNPFAGWVSLYILPGYCFRMVDAVITNFHLPRSTLLMLVSAFAGKELITRAYNEAISENYRFYSFGDAMFIS